LNNFLSLPVNLTVQANQKGEFTDISYIFLALVPGILLLRFRKAPFRTAYGAYLLMLFVLYFLNVPSINSLLSGIQLPIGYVHIIIISVLPLVLLHLDAKTSEKNEEDSVFLTFFAFITLYCLIFLVAAYGIVWYGIYMYFGFLAIVAMSVNSDRFTGGEKALTGAIVVLIVLPYFLVSVIPHAWNNLPEDGMEFKVWKTSEYEGIFQGRPEYIKVMEKFNLRDVSIAREKILRSATNPDLKKILENYAQSTISDIVLALELAQRLALEKPTLQYRALALDAKKVKEYAYEQILYPSEDNRNPDKIYRMGTFLTYYISENRNRFYDDSLITQFGTYFKGKGIDTTAENMKKLGIKYLLVDLNAATIDQDPRRDLTRRYEEILDFIRSDKVRLVATDSLCLQVALDLKRDKNYMNLAGTNYISYVMDESGVAKAIMPKDKTDFCGKVLAQIIMENRVTQEDFAYLKPMGDYVKSRNAKTQEEALGIILPYIGRTWMGAFELVP
jgi:hypothetical protein